MTLQEVAAQLAQRVNGTVEPAGEDAPVLRVVGNGYHFDVSSFFGGWQATLYIPEKAAATFYGEAAESLELRLKAKLQGLDANF